MANLKEIRTRIASVSSTMQITSAMKMVSASKLRRSQSAILQLRPYSAKMREVIRNLCEGNTTEIPLARQSKPQKVLLVVLSSNKGLCSTFNSNIIKATLARIDYWKEQNPTIEVSISSFGKRGTDFFKKQNDVSLIASKDEIWDSLTFDAVSSEAEKIIAAFLSGKWDKIEVIYNQFKNASTQILTCETFLPIDLTSSQGATGANNDYIYEPSKESIISEVVPQSLKMQLFKCFLDSFASEHGARMTSMHKATDNASNLLKELKLTYNKARQAAITNEIIEISSGAEALNG